jgi:hypothetical protein
MAETSAVPMVASWLVLLMILMFAIGVGCLLSARSRIVGVVLLALLAFGFFSVRVQVQRSVPRGSLNVALDEHGMPVAQIEKQISDAGNLHDAQEHSRRAEAAANAAAARARAEILRNQRLTASINDATLQIAPDGTRLETYPDGMQIKQKPSGVRSIVREADGQPVMDSRPAIHSGVKLWILGAPLLALVVAFVALRSRPRASGYGMAIVAAAMLAVVLGGYMFMGSRHVYIPEPVEVKLEPPGSAMIVQRSADGGIGSHGEVVEQPPVSIPPAESIEAAWAHLTGPKIKLEANDSANDDVSQKELVAAKTVLTTTAPGVDPITQHWLASIAKATLHALAQAHKASEDQSVHATIEPMAEAIAEYEAAAEGNAGKELATSVPDEPRPDWLDDAPEKLVGASRRVVASSDPYMEADLARASLREELRGIVHARLVDLVAAASGDQQADVPAPDYLGISDDYILGELSTEQYLETVQTSVGEMKRAHALVEFTEAKDRFMLERWMAYARLQSIEFVGGMSTLAVGGLALVYGLLKVDTWTRGYYTKRLFIGVPAAIIALVMLMLA